MSKVETEQAVQMWSRHNIEETSLSGVAESRDESITESLEDSFKILQNHPVIQQRRLSDT